MEIVMQEEPETDLSILQQIVYVKETQFDGDASGMLQDGFILLGVAKNDNDSEGSCFRYSLGWPCWQGVPDDRVRELYGVPSQFRDSPKNTA